MPFELLVCNMMRKLTLVSRRVGGRNTPRRTFSARSNIANANPDTVVYTLMGVNVGVYALWQQPELRKFLVVNFTTSLPHLKSFKLHTLLTSTLSHKDTSHLLSNMIGLYFMGSSSIRVLGNVRFLRLYLLGGVFASAGQIAIDSLTSDRYKLLLGASGSVSAIVAHTILTNPRAIFYLYLIIPVPAALFGVYFIGKDIAGLLNERSTVGNAAHLGGAAFGGLTYMYYRYPRAFRFK